MLVNPKQKLSLFTSTRMELWKHNKYNFIYDQFTSMFSDRWMFCNSFKSYFDNFREQMNNKSSNQIACM